MRAGIENNLRGDREKGGLRENAVGHPLREEGGGERREGKAPPLRFRSLGEGVGHPLRGEEGRGAGRAGGGVKRFALGELRII